MAKRPKYPYPVAELIAYLERTQEETQDDYHLYGDLARMLKICHATMQHAHEIWQARLFEIEGPEIAASDAIQYGLGRLVPLIIDHTVSGWPELLTYIEHPEQYSWYDPDLDCPLLPPLQVQDEEEYIDDEELHRQAS